MTAIEKSQNEFMRWAAMPEAQRTPVCPQGFGNDCDYPACKCGAMPIKADNWPVIDFAGDEPDMLGNQISRHWTQEQHADHLEATREPRNPAHFRPLVKYALASALMVVLAAVIVFA